jgi:hypothetical protein
LRERKKRRDENLGGGARITKVGAGMLFFGAALTYIYPPLVKRSDGSIKYTINKIP